MRADRLLSLLLLLQAHGRMTAHDLATRLEVSERTIYRDIEALGMSGVPVYAERGPNGGCALVEGYRTNVTGMTDDEIRTLFMSGASRPLADLGLSQSLEAALLKLLAALPSSRRHDAELARQRIHVDAAGWGRAEESVPHLRALQEAVWNDRRLAIAYRQDESGGRERFIDPLGLVAKASIWYLVANVVESEIQTSEKLRVYRVSRIVSVRETGEAIQRPARFDLAAFWEVSCAEFEARWDQYSAQLRVSRENVPHFPDIFGERARALLDAAPPPDAMGGVTITAQFDSFEAARARILSLGARVEVIEPPELRIAVARLAAEVAEFYAARATTSRA